LIRADRRVNAPHLMRQRGFTLIEILVVVAVIGLAMTVVAVSISGGFTSAKVRGASRDLIANLRYTRGQAIVKHEAKVLMLNVDERQYTAPGKKPVTLPDGIDITIETARQEQVSEGEAGIRFYPDGSSTGGNIQLSRGETVWRIDVNWLTGEVRLREPE
jgi:general secretion pathway protein H